VIEGGSPQYLSFSLESVQDINPFPTA